MTFVIVYVLVSDNLIVGSVDVSVGGLLSEKDFF
ncbi:hypothetical protein SAMN06295960_3370 [Paenibacillus aquistagni]|uniref:Uncharacterized protein n=1 Tax=Paenibacillus aquistagni TaxID=1852522 RepID=A0A1X7LEL6_9BACL|nr:hypothetical protein SAMN06295960_3370 [Paenibacillus aquistagni]